MTKIDDFNRIGGRASLIAINKVFYDKVYQHPWLKQYFLTIPQQHIEDQQVDFMQKVLGGENHYIGKAPPVAHSHMFIPDELFDVRKQLLVDTFSETGTHPELIDKWLNLDESFRRILVKKSPSECKPRFTTDPILNFDKPK
ncbi:group I truncated hemoglobin [Colwellia sp. 12G3]|uniref:group I truncated hemoglobin n=1 Tax=Colwellia sp. 12G3 TaxID=2058299 RepID=UPI000C31DBCA|nr:group 1 truncated hemoglobin [Colwellia sp. 12G3]PKI16132.1 group 1 truncated hemoglobin [Colwellia sp. 12G3]